MELIVILEHACEEGPGAYPTVRPHVFYKESEAEKFTVEWEKSRKIMESTWGPEWEEFHKLGRTYKLERFIVYV